MFGAEDTGSHACYMIYGILKPGEKGRLIKPGKGHEEMFAVMAGSIRLTGELNATLETGQAIHLAGEQSCELENPGEANALYVLAGGHSDHGHHH